MSGDAIIKAVQLERGTQESILTNEIPYEVGKLLHLRLRMESVRTMKRGSLICRRTGACVLPENVRDL